MQLKFCKLILHIINVFHVLRILESQFLITTSFSNQFVNEFRHVANRQRGGETPSPFRCGLHSA